MLFKNPMLPFLLLVTFIVDAGCAAVARKNQVDLENTCLWSTVGNPVFIEGTVLLTRFAPVTEHTQYGRPWLPENPAFVLTQVCEGTLESAKLVGRHKGAYPLRIVNEATVNDDVLLQDESTLRAESMRTYPLQYLLIPSIPLADGDYELALAFNSLYGRDYKLRQMVHVHEGMDLDPPEAPQVGHVLCVAEENGIDFTELYRIEMDLNSAITDGFPHCMLTYGIWIATGVDIDFSLPPTLYTRVFGGYGFAEINFGFTRYGVSLVPFIDPSRIAAIGLKAIDCAGNMSEPIVIRDPCPYIARRGQVQ